MIKGFLFHDNWTAIASLHVAYRQKKSD